jgi:transposase
LKLFRRGFQSWNATSKQEQILRERPTMSAEVRLRQVTAQIPNAAGVDVGANEIYVSVPPDRDPECVRSFPTFTADLHDAADWLQSCGIDTVAMESTGVYWIPFFQDWKPED